jgi:hypothetical protein
VSERVRKVETGSRGSRLLVWTLDLSRSSGSVKFLGAAPFHFRVVGDAGCRMQWRGSVQDGDNGISKRQKIQTKDKRVTSKIVLLVVAITYLS